MSECTRTPRTSTSVAMSQASTRSLGLCRLAWAKLEPRRFQTGFVVGETGSCDVLLARTNVANVANAANV